jgi:hypothetical protein
MAPQTRLVLAAGLLAAAGGFFWYKQSQGNADAFKLVQMLPREGGMVAYVDFAELRAAGLLTALSKASEEPDYRKFVEQSGFDYTRDLEAVAVSFLNGEEFGAARGKFDWKRLAAYAAAQGGSCKDSLCSLPASKPESFISFYPLRSNVLAIAVSHDASAASKIDPPHGSSVFLDSGAVAFSAVGSEFEAGKSLPAGAQAFLSPLSKARRVAFYAGQAGRGSPNLELRLDAECLTQESAEELAKQLTKTTELLKNMLARQKMTARPDDLSGLLVAGSFTAQNGRVAGRWPLSRTFVESLVGGVN